MFILLPTTYIYIDDNDIFHLGNMLNGKAEITVKSIDEIMPSEKFLNCKIFVDYTEVSDIKNYYLEILEKRYNKSSSKIGYIETTSICPYLCRMCPKYDNKLIRKQSIMEEKTFNRAVEQITNQEIELHLFGDPFCDNKIIERIKYLNMHKIFPSFSTNLISILNFNLENLKDCYIKYLTISIDTFDAQLFSEIRGNMSDLLFQNCINKLRRLVIYAERTKCIFRFIFQVIDLNINIESREAIKKMAVEHKNCIYNVKKFIKFPNVNIPKLETKNIFDGNEKVLIYQLLNRKLPFKCLKVWNKKEKGITSDGKIVPCCMSYNAAYDLGNILDNTLKEIEESKKYFDFRQAIWNNTDAGEICNKCSQNSLQLYHKRIPYEQLKYLSIYCIENW